MTYPRLEIDENGTRNVVLVVRLVEKHVLAIAAFRRPLFQNTFFVDPVFGTESLPVHGAHFKLIARSLSSVSGDQGRRMRKMDMPALEDGRTCWEQQGAHFGFHIVRVGLSRFREA